jgi:hypothetical protein
MSREERPKLHECIYLHVKKKTHVLIFLSGFRLFSSYSVLFVSKFLLIFTFKTFCNQSMPCWLKNEVYKVQVNTREALIRRIKNTAAKKSIKQVEQNKRPS